MCHLKVLSLLILASVCWSAPQSPGDIDLAILNVFNTSEVEYKPTTPAPGSLADLVNQDNMKNRRPSVNGGTILGVNNPANLGKPTDCECVPYYQCQNGTIIDDGIGLIDIRSGFGNDKSSSSLGSTCENYLDICCQIPNIVTPDEKITPRPVPLDGCGRRHADGVGFRITGNVDEAQFGEFPWMVAILKEEKVGGENGKGNTLNLYQCGGALIHPQAVLTAAHCAIGKKPSQLKVRAGEWDTQTKTEIFPHQDRNVQKIIIHEDFNSGSLRYDYAILILSEPVKLTENVDVVCLPEQGEQFDGSRCFASGWGKDKFGQAGHYQVILKRVELPVVPRVTCENSLRSTRLGNHFVLSPSFICAGGESGKDTCKGDGGSPLVCPSKNDPTRFVQAGIVAWGIGCGETGVPGVYANIAAVRKWIDEKMAYNNLNTYVYTY